MALNDDLKAGLQRQCSMKRANTSSVSNAYRVCSDEWLIFDIFALHTKTTPKAMCRTLALLALVAAASATLCSAFVAPSAFAGAKLVSKVSHCSCQQLRAERALWGS
jgi:hypothetical protein